MVPTSVNSILKGGGGLCWIGIKKTKCRGDLREDMPERGKKTKCGGGGSRIIERVCRRGIKKTKWRGGVAKKIEGGGSMLERGKEDEMREAGVAKKLRGGYAGEG